MLPIRTILYPTDLSEPSAHAFRLACSLARDYGANLIVLHVIEPPVVVYGEGMMLPQPDVDPEFLRQKLEELHPRDPKVHVEHRLVEGDPVAEILTVAREIKPDVVVMSTHGRTGLGRVLMGSVAEQVVRKAPCPVVTIKFPVPEAQHAKESSAEVVHRETELVPQ